MSLRYQVKGGNNSHADPIHNIIHKRKIVLSRFDGENNQDGIQWINKIEKNFEMYNIYGDDKLNVAAMYMDKTACDLFLWWDSTMDGGRRVRDWDNFKKISLNDFKTWKKPKSTEVHSFTTRMNYG